MPVHWPARDWTSLEGEEFMEEEERLLRSPESDEKLRMMIRQHIPVRRPDVVITPHIAFYSREAEERRIPFFTVQSVRAPFFRSPGECGE